MSSKESASIPVPSSPPQDFHFKYTVQKGLFQQSESSTDDIKFDFRKQNFGLIDRTYPTDASSPSDNNNNNSHNKNNPWPRFETYIRNLSSSLPSGSSLKVLFLGRHGQGYHNVAEAQYGTAAWDCYYSFLDGYDGVTWADARLTPAGEQQARDVHALWAEQLRAGIPLPERFYISPLTRTLQTAELSFTGLEWPSRGDVDMYRYTPYVKELLREALGVHTCDRRSSRTEIEAAFPHAVFEPGFADADADPLWEADYREPRAARRYRLAAFLDDVFANEEGTFLSFTSHSGAIRSILEAVGHRQFALETGGVIPVVVKAERVEGRRKVPPREPSEAPPLCDGPPDRKGRDVNVE